MKLLLVRGAPPPLTPLLALMKAVQSVLRNAKPGTCQDARTPGRYLKMSASAPKLMPPMSAKSRIGPS